MTDTNEAAALDGEKVAPDAVTVKRLTLVNEEGVTVACLHGFRDGAGLWLHGPGNKQPMIAIYTLAGQQAIGLYESTSPKGPLPLALSLHDGRPQLQLMDPKVGMDSLVVVDLLDLVGRLRAAGAVATVSAPQPVLAPPPPDATA